jgi:hypothetical protein
MNRFIQKLIALTCLIILGVYLANRFIPPQHLFWRAIDIEAPTGFATQAQLFRVSLSRSSTCAALADNALALQSSPADPVSGRQVCGWRVARSVSGSANGQLSSAATMQCPLALGVYIWIREIDGLAQKHLGAPLKTIHHYGTYSCRRQAGNSSGQWSEHAFANAWDVSGFELTDGQRISVLKHWKKGTRDQKAFLRGVKRESCKIFRVTLSPDFNAAHADHFHVDMGPNKSCR